MASRFCLTHAGRASSLSTRHASATCQEWSARTEVLPWPTSSRSRLSVTQKDLLRGLKRSIARNLTSSIDMCSLLGPRLQVWFLCFDDFQLVFYSSLLIADWSLP